MIVAPGRAASTAAWIEPPGRTTTAAAEAAGAPTTTEAATITPAAANRIGIFQRLISVPFETRWSSIHPLAWREPRLRPSRRRLERQPRRKFLLVARPGRLRHGGPRAWW